MACTKTREAYVEGNNYHGTFIHRSTNLPEIKFSPGGSSISSKTSDPPKAGFFPLCPAREVH